MPIEKIGDNKFFKFINGKRFFICTWCGGSTLPFKRIKKDGKKVEPAQYLCDNCNAV